MGEVCSESLQMRDLVYIEVGDGQRHAMPQAHLL